MVKRITGAAAAAAAATTIATVAATPGILMKWN